MSTFRSDLFAGQGSGITSTVYLVADAAELRLELDIDSATTVTVDASNGTGFREALADDDWSTLTTIVGVSANAIYDFEPGFRWLRVLRETASNASLARATVSGRNVVWGRG